MALVSCKTFNESQKAQDKEIDQLKNSLTNLPLGLTGATLTNGVLVITDGTGEQVKVDLSALVPAAKSDRFLSKVEYVRATKSLRFTTSADGEADTVLTVKVADLLPVTAGNGLIGDGTANNPLLVRVDGSTVVFDDNGALKAVIPNFTDTTITSVDLVNNVLVFTESSGNKMKVDLVSLIKDDPSLLSATSGNLLKLYDDGLYYGETAKYPNIYVSSSLGDDNNSGIRPIEPVKTIAKALSIASIGVATTIHLYEEDEFILTNEKLYNDLYLTFQPYGPTFTEVYRTRLSGSQSHFRDKRTKRPVLRFQVTKFIQDLPTFRQVNWMVFGRLTRGMKFAGIEITWDGVDNVNSVTNSRAWIDLISTGTYVEFVGCIINLPDTTDYSSLLGAVNNGCSFILDTVQLQNLQNSGRLYNTSSYINTLTTKNTGFSNQSTTGITIAGDPITIEYIDSSTNEEIQSKIVGTTKTKLITNL